MPSKNLILIVMEVSKDYFLLNGFLDSQNII